MKVGVNWKSGTDLTSLQKVKKEKVDIEVDQDFNYRFDNKGLLSERGLFRKAPEENIASVKVTAEHGFLYMSSKEFFFYSDKKTVLVDPIHTDTVPEYIMVSLGSNSGIPEEFYTIYSFSGIPTFLTPMVLTKLSAKDIEAGIVVRDTLHLEEVNRKLITKLEEKVSGVEEPVVEIYETETIKKLNSTRNNIVNPSNYIYNPFDGNVYVKGIHDKMLIEFESSLHKRVELGKKFSPSRTGKDKGMLVLTTAENATRASDVSSILRKTLDRYGSVLYVKQNKEDTVILVPKTKYHIADGTFVEYTTVENNFGYALIHTDLTETDIYVSSVLVGRTDNNGNCVVPIVGYIENGYHNNYIVEGPRKVNINMTEIGLVEGTLCVEIYDATTMAKIWTEDFYVNKQRDRVSVANGETKSKYISPGAMSVVVNDIVNIGKAELWKLRDTFNQTSTPIPIELVEVTPGENGVTLYFEPQEEATLLVYETLPFRVAPVYGGGFYGI